jgi:hypothetical protein
MERNIAGHFSKNISQKNNNTMTEETFKKAAEAFNALQGAKTLKSNIESIIESNLSNTTFADLARIFILLEQCENKGAATYIATSALDAIKQALSEVINRLDSEFENL